MPKSAHLKTDDASLSSESLEAVSFTTSSTSLSDSFDSSATVSLVSYTSSSGSPPPPRPRAASPVAPSSEQHLSSLAKRLVAKVKSLAESEPRRQSKSRRASRSSEDEAPRPIVESLLLRSAMALTVPCKTVLSSSPEPHPALLNRVPAAPTSLQAILAQREELMSELIAAVGHTRADTLFVNHVRQWHFLLMYAEEDAALGDQLRLLLEEGHQHVTVANIWDIPLGGNKLDTWQRQIESSTVILVLMSRALFRNKKLDACFAETHDRCRSLVPLYVEPLAADDIPPNLTPISQRSGREIFAKDWDARSYVQSLHSSYEYELHYGREVSFFKKLLEKIRNDADYTCRCENC